MDDLHSPSEQKARFKEATAADEAKVPALKSRPRQRDSWWQIVLDLGMMVLLGGMTTGLVVLGFPEHRVTVSILLIGICGVFLCIFLDDRDWRPFAKRWARDDFAILSPLFGVVVGVLMRSFSEDPVLVVLQLMLGFMEHAVELSLGLIALCLSFLFMCWGLRVRRRHLEKFMAVFGANEPLQTWKSNQEWRKPTGIRFLEDRKVTLLSHEEFLKEGREAALNCQKRRVALREQQAGFLKTMWCERRTRPYDEKPIEKARLLCEQLDRLWTGDAHIEIEDWKDSLPELKRKRDEAASADAKYVIQSYAKKILEAERALRDLAEIVRRVQERAKVSPNEAKLREAQEIHVNDVHHDMTKAFLGVLSQMEIFRKRAELKQQVTSDPSFTKDEKERLFAKIDELAAAADSKTAPARQSKPGSIYKEG